MQRGADRLGVCGVAQHVDAEVGDHEPHDRPADPAHAMGVLDVREVLGAGHAARLGPDQRQQAGLERPLVQLDVAAELEAADHVEELLEGGALAVEEQLVARVEHAEVAEHLALVGEERGVAAGAGLEALDVVRHLAVEELLRLAPRERELAALGAVDDRAALEHRPVRVRARVRQRHHAPSS